MADRLRLFSLPSAFPNPQRLRLFRQQKGVADQFAGRVYGMTRAGEHWQWRHLKMSPWGEPPTLQRADRNFLEGDAGACRPGQPAFARRTRLDARRRRAYLLGHEDGNDDRLFRNHVQRNEDNVQ